MSSQGQSSEQEESAEGKRVSRAPRVQQSEQATIEETTSVQRSGAQSGRDEIQRSVGAGAVSRKRSAGSASPSDTVNYDPGPDVQRLSETYGIDFCKGGQAEKVQRLEQDFGSQKVQRWADEGMTVDAMGKPRDMRAYRERKANRTEEIPDDIERQNQASYQRNVYREGDEGPAGDAGAPDAVRNVISKPGKPLDGDVQREMESKMGGDFSAVQVHTGPEAAAAADSIHARAFTVGNHVAFNEGEYKPGSESGKKVLAHELTHVRQQTEGRVSLLPKSPDDKSGSRCIDENMHLQPKLEVSSPDDPAEKEAERVAEEVVQTSHTSNPQRDESATSPIRITQTASRAAPDTIDRSLGERTSFVLSDFSALQDVAEDREQAERALEEFDTVEEARFALEEYGSVEQAREAMDNIEVVSVLDAETGENERVSIEEARERSREIRGAIGENLSKIRRALNVYDSLEDADMPVVGPLSRIGIDEPDIGRGEEAMEHLEEAEAAAEITEKVEHGIKTMNLQRAENFHERGVGPAQEVAEDIWRYHREVAEGASSRVEQATMVRNISFTVVGAAAGASVAPAVGGLASKALGAGAGASLIRGEFGTLGQQATEFVTRAPERSFRVYEEFSDGSMGELASWLGEGVTTVFDDETTMEEWFASGAEDDGTPGRMAMSLIDVTGAAEAWTLVSGLIRDGEPLTGDEVSTAQRYIGDTIDDYDKVRVVHDSSLAEGNARAFVTGHVINLAPNSSSPCPDGNEDMVTLVHELVHIAQFESDGTYYIVEALHAQNLDGISYSFYLSDLEDNSFDDFNPEQQASIVGELYRLDNGIDYQIRLVVDEDSTFAREHEALYNVYSYDREELEEFVAEHENFLPAAEFQEYAESHDDIKDEIEDYVDTNGTLGFDSEDLELSSPDDLDFSNPDDEEMVVIRKYLWTQFNVQGPNEGPEAEENLAGDYYVREHEDGEEHVRALLERLVFDEFQNGRI